MKEMKILVPLDGTEQSRHSLQWLKETFDKGNIQITLMNVIEIIMMSDTGIAVDIEKIQERSKSILNDAEKELEDYQVEKFATFGYAADEILRKAREDKFDIIIMTKSNKKGLSRMMIGSVTSKVVKNAEVIVVIIPQ